MKIIYTPWSKGIEYCYKLVSIILSDDLEVIPLSLSHMVDLYPLEL
ncbi:MAG: hypothetical protein QXE81_01950 [Desulfurococcaceae archaeon]